MPVCRIVKLIPLGTVDDLMHYCSHFIFLDNTEKFKKNLSKVLKTFANIMENGAFAL